MLIAMTVGATKIQILNDNTLNSILGAEAGPADQTVIQTEPECPA